MRTLMYGIIILICYTTNANADGIPFKDLVNDIRQQLVELKGEDHSQKMLVNGIKLELQTVVSISGEGKISYLIVEVGGKYNQSEIQKFTFDLTLPEDQKLVYNHEAPATGAVKIAAAMYAATAGWEDGNVLVFANHDAKQAAGEILRGNDFDVTEFPMGMNFTAHNKPLIGVIEGRYKQPIPVRDTKGKVIGYVVDPENIKNPFLKKLKGVFISKEPNTVIQPDK